MKRLVIIFIAALALGVGCTSYAKKQNVFTVPARDSDVSWQRAQRYMVRYAIQTEAPWEGHCLRGSWDEREDHYITVLREESPQSVKYILVGMKPILSLGDHDKMYVSLAEEKIEKKLRDFESYIRTGHRADEQ